MGKKLVIFKKWPNVFFHGQRISKMANFLIGHEMADLATLATPTFHKCVEVVICRLVR